MHQTSQISASPASIDAAEQDVLRLRRAGVALESRHQPVVAPARLNMLVGWFALSLTDISNATGRAVSRSQIHRILRGQARATVAERAALASAFRSLLAERLDSGVLFDRQGDC